MIVKKWYGIVFIFCLLMGMVSSVAFAKGEIICYFPVWDAGEKQTYEITQTKTKDNTTASIKYNVTIEVVEAGDDGYVLNWEPGKVQYTQNVDFKASDNVLNDLFAQQVCTYETDEYGTYLGLKNLEELKEDLQKKLDFMASMLPAEEDKGLFKKISDSFLSSDVYIESTMATEIGLLHNSYINGYEYEAEELYRGEIEFQNPFSADEPIPGIVEIVASKDEEGLKIEITQKMDIEKCGEAVFGWLKEMANGNEEFVEQLEKADVLIELMNITDTLVYRFAEDDNWLREVTYSRTSKILDHARVDAYQIKRVD